MIELVVKEKCSGCCSCFNACKVGALLMKNDKTGFWFPQIDRDKCVECGECTRACPALEKPEYKDEELKAYIVQNKDDEIRRQSTSGGAFTGIAKQIIAQGGVVFGASIDGEYNVSHIWVDNEADLAKLRGSKYVQSWIGTSYRDAEKFLKKGRRVCFSGTPCQTYGFKKYLGKEYDNLLTVDVMCRAVPSPKVLKKYLEYQREKYPSFDRIVFRDKGRGYSYSGVALYEGSKLLYRGGSESDSWLRLFLQGYCNREACHECYYQDGARASDITLWDCWSTQNYVPEWDDNKGTTNAISWNGKGRLLLIECETELRIREIGIDHINVNLKRNSLQKASCDRMIFFRDCDTMLPKEFMGKYAPTTVKVRVKSIARSVMCMFHIHDTVRKAIHKQRKAKKIKGRNDENTFFK